MPNKPQTNSEILDRQPPRDLDAEKAVLGSILLVPSVCDDVSVLITAADFHDDANGLIFGHLLALWEAGKSCDMKLLVNRLQKASQLDRIGGAVYLAEVCRAAPTAANARHYAAIVRDLATRRSIIEAATVALRDAYEDRSEPDALLEANEAALFTIRERRIAAASNLVTAGDVLASAMDLIHKREGGTFTDIGLETGFADLDDKVSLRPGALVIVAARPSMGKSSLALALAMHAACEQNQSIFFFSLEMSQEEIAERMMACHAKINTFALRRPPLAKGENERLMKTVADLSAVRFTIDDTPGRTVSEIAALCRRQKRKHLGLVVVDYLQLLTAADPRATRQEQVSQITRDLKLLARSLKVPIIVCAQLNRQAENTTNPRPKLHHLRESGAIEQDADLVLFIHNAENYLTPEEIRKHKDAGDPEGILGRVEIIIAKQRNGPTGDVKLAWFKEFTRFENLAKNDHLKGF